MDASEQELRLSKAGISFRAMASAETIPHAMVACSEEAWADDEGG